MTVLVLLRLVRDFLRGLLDRGRVAKVKVPDGCEIVIQFVDKWDSCRDIQSDDIVVRDVIQIFH